MVNDAYEEGKRDGKIEALEAMLNHHSDRLDIIETRQRWQDRVIWTIIGSVALLNALPALKVALT